jgi:[CysO sulfur-carrier protein]-S-L-cysteine hydrolase
MTGLVDDQVIKQLIISQFHWEMMNSLAQTGKPEEVCGLLGGIKNQVKEFKPITNRLHSTIRFEMSPEEQVTTFIWFEDLGYELIAIFHSHPAGPAVPSETDLNEFAYPGIIMVVWSPSDRIGGWIGRAYRIEDRNYIEIPILTIAM